MQSTSPPPHPSRVTIESIMVDSVAIYRHVPPPGRTIPVEVTPFPVKYYIPEEAEVAEAVKRLRLNRLGRPLSIQAEHLRQWIWEAMR